MIIDLLKLRNNIEKNIILDSNITFDNEKLKQADLLDIKDTKVKGEITKDSLGNINLYLKVKGIMVMKCALTLDPVDHSFEFEVEDNIENLIFDEKSDKKIENTIDILPIIWENILMEIPMRVVSENAKPEILKGEGWQFITETTTNKINPELEKLKELL